MVTSFIPARLRRWTAVSHARAACWPAEAADDGRDPGASRGRLAIRTGHGCGATLRTGGGDPAGPVRAPTRSSRPRQRPTDSRWPTRFAPPTLEKRRVEEHGHGPRHAAAGAGPLVLFATTPAWRRWTSRARSRVISRGRASPSARHDNRPVRAPSPLLLPHRCVGRRSPSLGSRPAAVLRARPTARPACRARGHDRRSPACGAGHRQARRARRADDHRRHARGRRARARLPARAGSLLPDGPAAAPAGRRAGRAGRRARDRSRRAGPRASLPPRRRSRRYARTEPEWKAAARRLRGRRQRRARARSTAPPFEYLVLRADAGAVEARRLDPHRARDVQHAAGTPGRCSSRPTGSCATRCPSRCSASSPRRLGMGRAGDRQLAPAAADARARGFGPAQAATTARHVPAGRLPRTCWRRRATQRRACARAVDDEAPPSSAATTGRSTARTAPTGARSSPTTCTSAIGVPNIWYRASMVVARSRASRRRTLRITGVTLPGLPGLVVGSNGHVAWGFTNTGGDWSDLVRIEPDPRDADTLPDA